MMARITLRLLLALLAIITLLSGAADALGRFMDTEIIAALVSSVSKNKLPSTIRLVDVRRGLYLDLPPPPGDVASAELIAGPYASAYMLVPELEIDESINGTRFHLYRYDLRNGQRHILHENVMEQIVYPSGVRVPVYPSPDGRRVAVLDSFTWSLYVIDLQTGAQHITWHRDPFLSQLPPEYINIAWSPDGGKIAVLDRFPIPAMIYVYQRDSEEPIFQTEIGGDTFGTTFQLHVESNLSWSSDSRYLLVSPVRRTSSPGQMHVLDAQTSQAVTGGGITGYQAQIHNECADYPFLIYPSHDTDGAPVYLYDLTTETSHQINTAYETYRLNILQIEVAPDCRTLLLFANDAAAGTSSPIEIYRVDLADNSAERLAGAVSSAAYATESSIFYSAHDAPNSQSFSLFHLDPNTGERHGIASGLPPYVFRNGLQTAADGYLTHMGLTPTQPGGLFRYDLASGQTDTLIAPDVVVSQFITID